MRIVIRLRRPALPLVLAAALLGLALAPALGVRAGVLMFKLGADPFTNNSSQHRTEVEPDTYSYGATIVAAFQVGRFTDGGSSDIGWATSTDDGRHWTNGFLPGITIYQGGSYARVSDPSVAYDAAHHTWVILSLALQGPGAGQTVFASRSTDGGLTWQNPVSVANQGGYDKTWIACDDTAASPYYGHCYAEWDSNTLLMSTSADGGLTWGPARAPANFDFGLGGQPVVQPAGRVIVPYSESDTGIGSFISSDGGQSWSATVNVASSPSHGVAGGIRTSPLPSAEIDGAGKVFVVWQDCRFRSGCSANDIVMSTSTDGLTWSAVTRIPIDAVNSTADHFIPGLAVDKATAGAQAHLGLAYYYYPVANCTPATCRLNVGFVTSPNAGGSWTSGINLAGPMQMNWLPVTNQGVMVGDYMSSSYDSQGKAHPVFALAHAPSGGLFDEAMYSPVLGLAVPPAGAALVIGKAGALPGVPPDHPPLRLLPTAR